MRWLAVTAGAGLVAAVGWAVAFYRAFAKSLRNDRR